MSKSTHRPVSRRIVQAGATITATGVLVVAGAGIASAHVTAHSPDTLSKGGYAEIGFRVPDEEATAHTVKVQVNFSTTSPIPDADVSPVAGWTAKVTTAKLAKPVTMAKDTVTDAVQSITWTAPAGGGLLPGQFQEFDIVVEGLPTNTDQMVMPAIQTYDNGDVVNWNQPTVAGRPEPEHPAPTLALVAADSVATPAADTASPPQAAATSTSDGTARWLGGAGLVLGALALGFGLGAFVRGRRSGPGGKGGTGTASADKAPQEVSA
jgi:uncharacterized protein YcnI